VQSEVFQWSILQVCICVQKLGRVETPYIYTNQAGLSGSRAIIPDNVETHSFFSIDLFGFKKKMKWKNWKVEAVGKLLTKV